MKAEFTDPKPDSKSVW